MELSTCGLARNRCVAAPNSYAEGLHLDRCNCAEALNIGAAAPSMDGVK
jgi:hypothetical protein